MRPELITPKLRGKVLDALLGTKLEWALYSVPWPEGAQVPARRGPSVTLEVRTQHKWLCDPGKLSGFPVPLFPCLQKRKCEELATPAGEEFKIIHALNSRLFLFPPNCNQIQAQVQALCTQSQQSRTLCEAWEMALSTHGPGCRAGELFGAPQSSNPGKQSH